MATVTLTLDDDLARYIEESARHEHMPVSEWIKARLKAGADRAATLATMEARARANGYPPEWLTLFGSLADDETFSAPVRHGTRPVVRMDTD